MGERGGGRQGRETGLFKGKPGWQKWTRVSRVRGRGEKGGGGSSSSSSNLELYSQSTSTVIPGRDTFCHHITIANSVYVLKLVYIFKTHFKGG